MRLWLQQQIYAKSIATEENLIAYGYEDKQSVEINGYLAAMFTPDTIERLLKTDLADRRQQGKWAYHEGKARAEYIEDCKDNLAIYFTEMLQAEGGKKDRRKVA